MTNAEAVKWIEAIRKKYIHGGDEGFDQKRNEAINLAISALERDRWISVEERLPETWETVFAAVRSEGRDDWVIEVVAYDQYLTCPWGHIPLIENGKAEVYAWMPRPLPEPPKEGT